MLVLLLLALAYAGLPATGKSEAAELARLKGVWKATSLQVGKKQPVRLRISHRQREPVVTHARRSRTCGTATDSRGVPQGQADQPLHSSMD